MSDIRYFEPEFVIQNISGGVVRALGKVAMRPGDTVELFGTIEGLSEIDVLDALRPSNGSLFKEIFKQRTLRLVRCRMMLLENSVIDFSNLRAEDALDGRVLSVRGNELVWIDPPVGSGMGPTLSVEAPIQLHEGVVSLGKASAVSNGYLSKDDWVLFSGAATGLRVWQYQDFEINETTHIAITAFEGSRVPFNLERIIDGSAVIVEVGLWEHPPVIKRRFFGKYRADNVVQVSSHVKGTVVLNRVPAQGRRYRIYFLINVPDMVGVGADIMVPNYVRKARIEMLAHGDIDASGKKEIFGKKLFKENVIFDKDIGVAGKASIGSLSISDGASVGLVLTANSVGDASWAPATLVDSSPPRGAYSGQLWVKIPEYELFVYDDERKKWMGQGLVHITGAKNASTVSASYLKGVDNINMDQASITLPYDCTLVSMSAGSDSASNWVAEIHVEQKIVTGAVLNIPNKERVFTDSLNIDFRAGDCIQFYANGMNIGHPVISAFFKRMYR